jgi:hypothetical protein
MFAMDVPYVPVQDTPIVLAQTTTSDAGGISQQSDYILNACQETEHTVDPRSALRGVDPAGLLGVYLENRDRKPVNIASIKITLLEGTKHGKIFAEVDNERLTSYHYDPESEYLGNDKAVFMAEFEGKHYKIVVDIKVLYIVDESTSQCGQPQLIKVNKPASGFSGFDSGYGLNSVSVTFADLPNAAVGQTTGSTITLDTNAAGNGWFIDTTPSDNSEFLPTSNPNEWVAKAVSAAAGKMDMLSVGPLWRYLDDRTSCSS